MKPGEISTYAHLSMHAIIFLKHLPEGQLFTVTISSRGVAN